MPLWLDANRLAVLPCPSRKRGAAMILQIETKRVQPDIVVLGFKGRITLGRESQQIETMVKDLVNQREKKLVFDLSGVDYIDSSGLGVLTYAFKAMQDSGGVL